MNVTGYDPTYMFFELISADLNDAILYVTFTSEPDGGGGGAGSAPMPEPTAGLLFLVGLSTIGYRMRQRR